ncbi:hypothetical protein [Virgibacillus necropolis]|uniref:Uncharacterized protein n=1 Tax=Virgibacillus necropolis TaxID=163877 RepID=A0A221M985_9BACI|nr:hypothetical protein [Virgibacillus necropolis]ASN04189.1 hypothetical protein CFK40_03785 [Virgibacillus necropolis]
MKSYCEYLIFITTRGVVRTHENAFRYFGGGIPDEIVYDQDELILVSEDSGDLILTREFQTYKEDRNLTIKCVGKLINRARRNRKGYQVYQI